MKPIHSVSLLVFTSVTVFCQAPAAHPEFDVASVRPAAPINASGQEKVNLGVHMDGSHVRIASFSLRDLVVRAYGVKAAQVTGPDWIASERYDVNATLPAGSTADDIPVMLQALLADRFKLKVHRDKKEFPVYALILGKTPLKLVEDALDPDTGESKGAVNTMASGSAAGVSVNLGRGSYYTFADNQFEAKKMSVDRLCLQLERYVDRPIINMTDLKGTYDVTLKLTPEDYQAMLIRIAVNSGVVLPPQVLQYMEGNSIGSLFEAIQQAGLKLDARKAPLDLIVVDQAQKTPTEN
jgi:uncharacterized protein (TIGR03435 family)